MLYPYGFFGYTDGGLMDNGSIPFKFSAWTDDV